MSGSGEPGTLKPWRRLGAQRLQNCRVFDLDSVRFAPPDGRDPRSFYVIEAPDWINVVPLTEDRQVAFVREFHFGDAALRELREDAGYEKSVPRLIRDGAVTHSLVIAAFYRLGLTPS